MKKFLILLFAVAVLAGCATWPEFGVVERRADSQWDVPKRMFETLTGIPAWAVKESERVPLHSRHEGLAYGALWLIRTISLMRVTDANVTYVLEVILKYPASENYQPITLVIGGREVMLKQTEERVGGEITIGWVLAEVPPEDVEELFASDDISIQCWDGPAIKLTEKEISYLRMLSPQKPQ